MREASNLNGFRAFSTKSPFSIQNLRKSSQNSQLSHHVDQSNSRYFVANQHSAIQARSTPLHHTATTVTTYTRPSAETRIWTEVCQ